MHTRLNRPAGPFTVASLHERFVQPASSSSSNTPHRQRRSFGRIAGVGCGLGCGWHPPLVPPPRPASAAGAADSTPAAHTLGAAGTGVPTHEPGVAGFARDHDGVDDELTIADPVDGSLDVGTQSFAYSVWMNSGGSVGPFDNPFFKGGTSNSNPGYCIMTGTLNPWIGKLQARREREGHPKGCFRGVGEKMAAIGGG